MKRLLATLISYGYPVEPGMTVGRARYDVSGSRVLVKPGMTYVVTLTCQSHLRHNEVIPDSDRGSRGSHIFKVQQ